MSATVARVATAVDHPLMVGYAGHCYALGVSDRALRDRLRLARRFLEVHPDLGVWMARPLPARLTDLRRIRAWPLISYAILSRRVAVDLDLLVAKDLGGFGATAEQLFPADYEAARAAAGRLGWTPGWTNAVLREPLAVVCAWRQHTMTELTPADIAVFDDAMAASTTATVSTRRAYRARLHSLQQLLFELRVLDTPPQRRRRAGSIAERLQAVPAPEIRRAMLRYLDTRAAVLRPATISSLCDSLIVFGEFLDAAYPRSPRCASSSETTSSVPAAQRDPSVARPPRAQPTRRGVGRARYRARGPQLPGRHHVVGLGGAARPAAAVRRRRAPSRAATAARPGPRPRRGADGCRHRAG